MLTQESAARKDQLTGKSEMQHRHFTTIAAIIRTMDDPALSRVKNTIAWHFANELAGTNSRFDRVRFLRACGVPI